jgi:hypothetical protein
MMNGKIELREHATGGPVLSTIEMAPAIAWTGIDTPNHLNVMYGDLRSNPTKVTLHHETSQVMPGLGAGDGLSFLAWTGTGERHRLNVASSSDRWRNYHKNTSSHSEASSLGPAIACGEGWVHLAYVGTDGRLNVVASKDSGKNFAYKATLSERSTAGPVLAFLRGTLYLLWQGTDQRLNLLSTKDFQGMAFKDKVTLDERSRFAPSMTMAKQYQLAWTGTDGRLNTLESKNAREFREKQTYRETSIAGPSVAVWQDVPVIAWAGMAKQLNVASLSDAPVPSGARAEALRK